MNEANTTTICEGENGNICIECGLCCDGSMFKVAGIGKHDDLTFLEQMRAEYVAVGDKQSFQLPCGGQEGKQCSLYNDERRFKVCKKFKCKLLKKYLSGEISYPAAIDIIKQIFIRRQSIKMFFKMLHSVHNSREPSIIAFIGELNRSGKLEDPVFRKTYSKQILDCFIFRELLKKYFYNNKKNEETDVDDK